MSPTHPEPAIPGLRWPETLPLLANVVAVAVELFAGYWVLVRATYDGFCYGFSDGKTACEFAEHARDAFGAFSAFWFLTMPLALVLGLGLLVVNFVLYELVRSLFVLRARRATRK